MSLFKLAIKILLLSLIIQACGNTPVPFKHYIPKKMTVDSTFVFDISNKILGFLNDADSLIDPKYKICLDAYKKWLIKQFENGLIPRKILTPAEYGVSLSHPNYSICPTVDMDKDFRQAAEKATDDSSGKKLTNKGHIFDMLSGIREKLVKDDPLDKFFDPEKKKFELTSMEINVLKNTLNIDTDRYNIYVTPKGKDSSPITPDAMEVVGAEEKYVESGDLLLLGTTAPIKAFWVGDAPVSFIEDKEQWNEVRKVLTGLDTRLVFMPRRFNADPQIIKNINGEFYVVPQGTLVFSVAFEFILKFSTGDAWNEWEKFKKDIKGDS